MEKNNYKFSFLLPTRERADLCINSLKITFNKLTDKNCAEILLAVDDDDEKNYTKIIDFLNNENISFQYKIFKRQGYENLHIYINELCKMATGTHLWLWNDDCFIETNKWDIKLKKHLDINKDLVVFDFKCNNNDLFNFPLLPKKIIDYLGHYSLHAHNDDWIRYIINDYLEKEYNKFNKDIYSKEIINIVPSILIDNINIFHYRSYLKKEVDYSKVDEILIFTCPDFFSKKNCELRTIDRNKLKELMK